jgi:hypothetical protein
MKKETNNHIDHDNILKETESINYEAPHLSTPATDEFDLDTIELWKEGLSMSVQFKMILDVTECRYYLNKIKQIYEEVHAMERDPEWGDGPDRLVSRHISYNIFQYEDFEPLYHRIRSHLPEEFKSCGYFIRGWINQLEPGEGLRGHRHSYPLSGHLTIHGTNCYTTYKNPESFVAIESPSGGLHLLSKGVYHEVTINKSESARVSIAFDVVRPTEVCPEFLPMLKEL